MYNDEVKSEFLEMSKLSVSTRYSAAKLFNYLEQYEEMLNKDIAEFNEDDVSCIHDVPFFNELSMLYLSKLVLRSYLDWCEENHSFCQIRREILRICDTESYDLFSNNKGYFLSADELVLEMNKIRSFDNGYASPVIFAFAWYGLLKEEIYHLTDDNVDMNNMVVTNDDGELLCCIDNEKIANVIRIYNECENGTRVNNKCEYKVIKDKSTNRFIKKFVSEGSVKRFGSYEEHQLDSDINKFNKLYFEEFGSSRFTFSNVWKSGCCGRLYALEKSGIVVGGSAWKKEVENIFRRKKKYRNAMWVYESYKSLLV